MDGNRSTMSRPMLLQNLNRLQVPVLKRHHDASLEKHIQLICCKKSRGKETLEESSLVKEKWKNLDPNILRDIFSRLPVEDLFISVSLVCQSWEATCWDFMFWSHKVLDLSATGAGFGKVTMSTVELLDTPQPKRAPGFFGKLDSQEKYNNMAVTLMRKLRRILEGEIPYSSSLQGWRVSLTTIIVPYDLEISDRHLFYIAERTPCVEYLLLLGSSKITVYGFVEALKCWKHLRGIHLGPIKDDDLFAQFINGVGANCKEIESLHIRQDGFRLDKRSALLIAQNLPRLRKLELELAVIKPSGITTLYNMCVQFEEVYFNGCQLERDIELRDIDPSFVQYKRRLLKNFRLTWTSDERGFANWQVTPCVCQIERIDDCVKSDARLMSYTSSSRFLEDKKARLQPEVEQWLLCAHVAPIRHRGYHGNHHFTT
ncbi:hypothetical protein RND81_10G034600 [Saponaria officinalis]|uniref:F-box domain-containing protein n=1 Tax=Saponaria officinalis TaxID=3572 RepID=A0AAW1HYQ1_SAPOF